MAEVDHAPAPTREPAPRPITQMILGGVVIPLLVIIGLGILVFSILSSASADLIVPDNVVLLVRTAPEDDAPLLARFGAGQPFHVTGRTADWRWLQVELWDGRLGWALRPLEILIWQIVADEHPPLAVTDPPEPAPLVMEEMVAVAGGTFSMGSPPGLGDNDETPVRVVTLSPFLIDRFEVTAGHYWECVIEEACTPPLSFASQTEPYYLNNPAFDNFPVINLGWEQARSYCAWRGKRLPTEAEWEMAAGWNGERGAKSLWPWGNNADSAEANVGPSSSNDTATVGSFLDDTSPNGLLDMGGNVREWVFDWYKVNYYASAENVDPRGPTFRRGEGTGRVVRGGSFADTIEAARTANRGHDDPVYGRATIGFRCAQNQ